jgi:hypothetical protein
MKDGTLQLPPRPARSNILELRAGGPNGEEIVAGHHVWQVTDPRDVDGVRVIADVQDHVTVCMNVE